MAIEKKYAYLPDGAAKYEGAAHGYALFIMDEQLKKAETWKRFVQAFAQKEDVDDYGWRGEYFGKMMRGACLTYRYMPDEELYDILYNTVKGLLATQEADGRITTYTKEAEFHGWDMWVRKYVMVGCMYFYGICKDEAFKEEILTALGRHLDCLTQLIGEGKLSILDTSHWYGGLNSSSILEPVVEMYRLTGKPEYLTFAEYILNQGGCKGGNLLELAEQGEKMPYEYPEVKAYEMMSYFEGALAYYEVTGKERYLHIVEKFVEAVRKSDITIIGCAGCTHELFDHSALKQTEEVQDKVIMQETCVTVTWMRLLERLLRLTGKEWYAGEIERSAYNALYGSVNIYGKQQYSAEEQRMLDGVPFDSYSPLVNQPRGIGIGGYKKFKEGGYYGCCACIGAAGTGLFPLITALSTSDGLAFNGYMSGEITYTTPSGQTAVLTVGGDYLGKGEVNVKISLPNPESFKLCLRIPSWSKNATVCVDGQTQNVEAGQFEVEKEWQNGAEIGLAFHPEVEMVELNGKYAFTYGNIVLARDEQKEENICTPISFKKHGGKVVAKQVQPKDGEIVRFVLDTDEGEVLLTDYASCGKNWTAEKARISVWFN